MTKEQFITELETAWSKIGYDTTTLVVITMLAILAYCMCRSRFSRE